MRTGGVIAIAGSLLALPAVAGPSAARWGHPQPAYRLVFLDADERAPVRQGIYDDATIEVGSVGAIHVRHRFRLRIDGGSASRFVRVLASVDSVTPGIRVRLDGRPLTPAPAIVDAASPLRVGIVHTLDIDVLPSEPAGALAQTISWTVEDSP
jgi:hypothetical protein